MKSIKTMNKLNFPSLYPSFIKFRVESIESDALLYLDSRRIEKVFSYAVKRILAAVVSQNIQKDLKVHMQAEGKDHIRRLAFLNLLLLKIRSFILDHYVISTFSKEKDFAVY